MSNIPEVTTHEQRYKIISYTNYNRMEYDWIEIKPYKQKQVQIHLFHAEESLGEEGLLSVSPTNLSDFSLSESEFATANF